jgi:hypothetical protein
MSRGEVVVERERVARVPTVLDRTCASARYEEGAGARTSDACARNGAVGAARQIAATTSVNSAPSRPPGFARGAARCSDGTTPDLARASELDQPPDGRRP